MSQRIMWTCVPPLSDPRGVVCRASVGRCLSDSAQTPIDQQGFLFLLLECSSSIHVRRTCRTTERSNTLIQVCVFKHVRQLRAGLSCKSVMLWLPLLLEQETAPPRQNIIILKVKLQSEDYFLLVDCRQTKRNLWIMLDCVHLYVTLS